MSRPREAQVDLAAPRLSPSGHGSVRVLNGVTPRYAYSVVVPCYCSSRWLPTLVLRIRQAMETLGEPFELLLVNDASPDDTWQAIEALCRQYPDVRGFDLLANSGQFRATICGLEHARGDCIVTMDDDRQHRPEDIPALTAALLADPEVDCVVAEYRRKHHGMLYNLGSILYHRMEGILYGGRPDLRMTAFRVMRRPVALAICAHRTARPVVAPLLLSSTRRIVNVLVDHQPRTDGTTGYSLSRRLGTVRDTVIAGSVAPLRAVMMIGFTASILSAARLLWTAPRSLAGEGGDMGFSTLALLVTLFGGLTLVSIGLLGEYVARILAEVVSPPRYQLRRVAGDEGGEN